MNISNKNRAEIIIKYITDIKYILPIIFKILFEFLYLNQFSVLFSYLGAYAEPSYEKFIVSWIVFFVLLFFCKQIKTGKLMTIYNIFMYLSVIPSISIYWLKNESTGAFINIVIYWSIWLIVTKILSDYLDKDEFVKNNSYLPSSTDAIISLIFCIVLISTIYFWLEYGDFRLFVKFNDVYTYRLDEENLMSSIGAYMFSWNTNLLIPLCLIIHLKNKKYILSIIDILLMFMSYSIYGNKSFFFTIFLVIGIKILSDIKLQEYIDIAIGGFLVVILLLLVFYPFISGIALTDRLLEGPSAGHYNYFDFFTKTGNEYLYLRESILKWVFNSPYEVSVSRIIGSSSDYYSGAYNNMSNGLFSDAYANFGFFGVIVYPILIVFTLFFLIKITKDLDISIYNTILLLSILFLFSAPYFNWLLTGGFMIVLIICKYFIISRSMMCRIGHMPVIGRVK